MVEQYPFKVLVVGSSPTQSTILIQMKKFIVLPVIQGFSTKTFVLVNIDHIVKIENCELSTGCSLVYLSNGKVLQAEKTFVNLTEILANIN